MKDYHGKEWECWCVEDKGIEYYLDVKDRETSLVAISAPEWWDGAKFLYRVIKGKHRPIFEMNSPELVRLMDKANEYFDAHDEDGIDPVSEARIRQIILRELRKRNIR